MVITDDMIKVEDLIKSGKNLFITGKAGTGKTTLLKKIQDDHMLDSVIVAPTGVAAINAGGVTIHSQFSLPIGFIDPNKNFEWRLPNSKKNVLKYAKYLIIDEISMVRCDIMDAIDKRLRSARKNKKPFGGIQVLMFGDMMKLPPVVTTDEIDVLSEYYDDFFFFNANVFKKTSFQTVVLSEVFRQTDDKYKKILNSIRNGKINENISNEINKLINKKNTDNAIHLCALRKVAENYNNSKIGTPTHIIKAQISGDFNPNNANCDLELKLKIGARVMITKNDTEGQSYVNGTLGVVEKIKDNAITIMTDDGFRVIITPNTWESFKYEIKTNIVNNEIETTIEKIPTGSCTQFPLTLAYAITIHKSQGLTFDNVVLHIREIFQSGQLYTALSRCRKLENMTIDAPITDKMLLRNPSIDNFALAVKNNNWTYGVEENTNKKRSK